MVAGGAASCKRVAFSSICYFYRVLVFHVLLTTLILVPCAAAFWRWNQSIKVFRDGDAPQLLQHVKLIFLDLLCFIAAPVFVVCPWRLCILYKRHGRLSHRKWLREAVEGIQDLPCVLPFILVCCSWRFFSLARQLKKAKGLRRRHVLFHWSLLIFDALAIVAVVVLFFSWRCHQIVFGLAAALRRSGCSKFPLVLLHAVIFHEFGCLCLDAVRILVHFLEVSIIALLVIQLPSLVCRLSKFYNEVCKQAFRGVRSSFRSNFLLIATHTKRYFSLDIDVDMSSDLLRQSPCTLADLPDELLYHIFKFLDGPALASVSGSCSRCYSIANDTLLWKALVKMRWPSKRPHKLGSISSAQNPWKKLYVDMFLVDQASQSTRRPDFEMGISFIIHDEFAKAVICIPHSICLPFKLLGCLC